MLLLNSQGSTFEYMKGNFDRAKSRDKLQLVNFESGHIKVNTAALQEILRTRKDTLFFATFYQRSLGQK